MATGTIKLGVYKKLSRNPLSRGQLESFFYGGAEEWTGSEKTQAVNPYGGGHHQQLGNSGNTQPVIPPARQHLILQTICRRWRNIQTLGRIRMAGNASLRVPTSKVSYVATAIVQVRILARRRHFLQNLFYDNPSRKRLARCTNIFHTGAVLSGTGGRQRLRKGFQGQMRSSASLGWPLTDGSEMRSVDGLAYFGESLRDYSMGAGMWESCLSIESLSSAAEIRHPARNTRLR